jgi:hypothetical protein
MRRVAQYAVAMRARLAAVATATVVSALGSGAATQSLPGWFDLPVHGGSATLAALGIADDERALTLSVLSRALHDREAALTRTPALVPRLMAATTTPAVGADSAAAIVEVPAPLDEATWRDLLGLSAEDDLFARLLTDRAALLLAAGLTATDRSVRTLVGHDRSLLAHLYREGHGGFLLASRALVVEGGRVVPPGGETGRLVWPTLTGQPLSEPAAFIRALVARDRGRLAWYYDAIAGLDRHRLAAAWPGPSPAARSERAIALYSAFRDIDGHWRADEQPLRRGLADAWMALYLPDLAGDRPASPLPATAWARLFSLDRLDESSAQSLVAADERRLTLPELVRYVAESPPRERRRRFEMFRLAQRAFGDEGSHAAALAAALSGYDRFPSLLTALEHMGVTAPETWARTVSAAAFVSDRADHARESLAVFQAAIALVDRLRHVRTLDAPTADRAVRELADAVLARRDAIGAVGAWIVDALLPLVPPLERPDDWTGRTAYESRLLQALAGRRDAEPPSLEWEGLTYRIDVAGAEHARLQAIRHLVPTPGLDAALANGRPREMAEALTALVYVTALGHADGAAVLGREVATRHDFGLRSSSLMRRLLPWSPPEERQGTGPWHVAGSLIGLDAGLSRLTLRRVADEHMPAAPTLTLNDLGTLTRTVVGLVPRDLTDAARDAMAAALVRGRQRVRGAEDVDELVALAREARMSAASRELLPWIAARQPASILGLFSLRDLLWLGGPPLTPSELDRWGVAADGLDGRRGLAMPAPAPWEDFAGRSDAGQITTQVPDVTLRLVEESSRLGLPAALIPALLAYAVEDYWHDVQVRFVDDWPRLVRQAAAIDGSRVEDYVAALVGDGVLRPQ